MNGNSQTNISQNARRDRPKSTSFSRELERTRTTHKTMTKTRSSGTIYISHILALWVGKETTLSFAWTPKWKEDTCQRKKNTAHYNDSTHYTALYYITVTLNYTTTQPPTPFHMGTAASDWSHPFYNNLQGKDGPYTYHFVVT